VPELQQQLETELLARTDLENRNMTLKEELSFKQQVIYLKMYLFLFEAFPHFRVLLKIDVRARDDRSKIQQAS
jgi:hypothetical protein